MKSASIIVAAAFTAAGMNFVPGSEAAGSNSAPTTAPSVIHTVAKTADATVQHVAKVSSDARIQGTLDSVTQAALTPGNMTKLVSMFTDSQQQSIKRSSTYSEGYGAKLNAEISSVNKIWKQKYGHDFSISKSTGVLNQDFAMIKTQTPAAKSTGMESATVDLTATSGSAKLDVPLICEKGNEWRISVPGSLTAEKLRSNLLAELTEVNDQSAHWPANETEAYRNVTDHVLKAVLDKAIPTATHAQALVASPQAVAKAVQPAPASQAKPVSASTSTQHWWKFW